MGAKVLVDTNVSIDLLASKLPAITTAWLEHQLNIHQLGMSVIVRVELLSW